MTKDIEREAFKLEMMDDYNMREVDTQFGKSFAMSSTNQAFKVWTIAKRHEAEKLKGCVVVPVESCKWTQDENSNWWTQCGEGFVFNEDPHPHKHNFKNCCFCGGLLEAARGGNE